MYLGKKKWRNKRARLQHTKMYEKYGFRPIFLIKVTCLFANSLAIQLKRELFSKTRAMALALASLRRERWLFGQYHLHLRTITHDCFIAIDAIQLTVKVQSPCVMWRCPLLLVLKSPPPTEMNNHRPIKNTLHIFARQPRMHQSLPAGS